jgi:hypothetical protein
MRILVVGSGGREHALCWKIAASPLCDKLYCAPGNAGIAAEAECVAIGAEDVEAITAFAKTEKIDFVVSDRKVRWSRAWSIGWKPKALPPSGRAPRRRRSKAPRAS